VLSENNTLHFRSVDILRYEDGQAIVASGLRSGEKICLSSLQYVVEGMPVTPIN
jgi:hypothetical protein